MAKRKDPFWLRAKNSKLNPNGFFCKNKLIYAPIIAAPFIIKEIIDRRGMPTSVRPDVMFQSLLVGAVVLAGLVWDVRRSKYCRRR